MARTHDFVIDPRESFNRVIRASAPPYIYAPITAITNAAPAKITSAAHGIPDGWLVTAVSVKGMVEINAANIPPDECDYHQATYVDANNVTINDVNSADYSVYTSGGYLQFLTPIDLTGCTARMTVRDRIGGTTLLALDTTGGGIVIDHTNFKISLSISATDTAAIAWKTGVYDIELVSPSGIVTLLLSGKISVAAK